MEIKYHYVRDMVERNAIRLRYISIDEQTTYILTKPLSRIKFVYFRGKLGMVENEALAEIESQLHWFVYIYTNVLLSSKDV